MSPYGVSRRAAVGAVLAAPLALRGASDGWIDLFDGASLRNWRPSENKDSWKVIDGALTANGPRSHLFYAGPVRNADFRNFELEVELTTRPLCNSGVYFHTAYQETGFPEKGFEIQVNNTARGDGGYLERKKTGSLYGIRNMYKQLVPDETPFRMSAVVRGKQVQIRLNGELLVDYAEPTPPVIPTGGEMQRYLDHGTFALQCHNEGSKAAFRSVKVRPLPDDLPAYATAAPVVDEVYREVINIGRHNVPIVDYHVYLRNGMTLEQALRESRADGIQYGITAPISTFKGDADADRWVRQFLRKPVFVALSIAAGDRVDRLSHNALRQFDYIIADSRVAADARSPDVFMDDLVDRTAERLAKEPMDIYAYPTYLPAAMRADHDRLWTGPRAAKLIDGLVRNQVAIELNSLEKLPSQRFILQAKEAGCKFAFGTGNGTAGELGRSEYGLQMVEACKLDWKDFFTPGSWWPTAIERQ